MHLKKTKKTCDHTFFIVMIWVNIWFFLFDRITVKENLLHSPSLPLSLFYQSFQWNKDSFGRFFAIVYFFRHVTRMRCGHLLGEVFRACPPRRRPWGRPSLDPGHGGEITSRCLGTSCCPMKELEEVVKIWRCVIIRLREGSKFHSENQSLEGR